jgi:hypothetical protein
MQLAERLRVAPLLRVRVWEPWGVLLPLVGLQWLLLGIFVLTVRHNGWLFYQGGDETFFYTSSWAIAHGHIPDAAIGWAWSYLTAPVAAVFGTSFLAALPVLLLIQTLILLPLGLLAMYGLAARIGGRLFGYLCAGLWVVGPYALIPLWDHRYHEKYVEQFLPQAFGLTGLGDFPSMICVVCAAYLIVRALDERSLPVAALAGVVSALAIGIKPANALFIGGVVLAFAAARQWREALVFGAGMAPGLVALLLWKEKGLGTLPILHSSDGSTGAIFVPAAALHLPHYVKLNWHQFSHNLDGLREFFWSVRVVEWFAVAGFLGLLRRAPAKALLVGGWFGAFLLVKGTSTAADIEVGTFLRLFMPALPALLILVAGVLLLVPTYSFRLADRFPPLGRTVLHWRSRRFAASLLLLGALPAILFAALQPLPDARAAKFFTNNTYVPTTTDLHLKAKVEADGVHLSWNAPTSPAKTFYRVFRSPSVWVYDYRFPRRIDGIRCNPPNGGASDCMLEMRGLATTTGRSYVDTSHLTQSRYTYRIGVMANYRNDTTVGDVLFVSKPVRVAPPPPKRT